MARDQQRIERVQSEILDAGWDALVCSLPTNVLMLTGYWPVVGSSLAIQTKDGRVGLIVPKDERELAEKGGAHVLRTFQGGSLDEIVEAAKAVRKPFAAVVSELGVGRVIGVEQGEFHEPSSYASMHFYGAAMKEIIAGALPEARIVPGQDVVERLRSVQTPHELERLRTACRIAQTAYTEGVRHLRAGLKETEVAARIQVPLSTEGTGFEGVERAGGFAFCMSGPNSAEAHAAYQRSRARTLATGDLALVHCNSYADGYWTDITRTFCLGVPAERQRRMYEAIHAASQAALECIKPGVKNADVDRVAREVLEECGFGKEFKHGSGHGVGYAAINHTAYPRIHPAAKGILETGMVFNVEPGIYFDGWGGMRHCDMVAVTEKGAELLTPFLLSPEELIIV